MGSAPGPTLGIKYGKPLLLPSPSNMFTKFHDDLICRFKITAYMGGNTVVLDGQAFSYIGLRSIRQEIPQK